MNWIKTHQPHVAALIGALLIIVGIIMLVPHSPWTLIAAGCFIIFCVLVLILPPMAP